MNKLKELKDGSGFFYNDLVGGRVVKAIKLKESNEVVHLLGDIDIMTEEGPKKLISTAEVYPSEEMAKEDLKKFTQEKIVVLKNKIQELEEELRIYEDAFVRINSNESD